jgi:hypothetical protein
VPGNLGERSGLPVPGDRAVHDRRAHAADALVVHIERAYDAGAKPFDDDVGVLRTREHRLSPGIVLQVHGRAALSRVEDGEQRGEHAHRIAAGRLDLHDVGAQLDEQLRGVRAGSPDAEIEHSDTGRHASSVPVVRDATALA